MVQLMVRDGRRAALAAMRVLNHRLLIGVGLRHGARQLASSTPADTGSYGHGMATRSLTSLAVTLLKMIE
jgi:hypothetical protein